MTEQISQGVVAGVRQVLDAGWSPEQTIRAIRRLLDPPGPPVPVQRTERGWPVLRASTWDCHDDPELP
ncbi:hypothetical protein ACQHIV_29540 [Kribbella sp. GL6]|uniref:hypothetical protein n=1 Tax=Kribbella sp. GL6 TaxID=3419765 RepID=UPI003D073CF4